MTYNNEIIQDDLKKICETYDLEGFRGKTVLVTGALGMLAYYYAAALMYLNDNYDYGIKLFVLARKKEALEGEFGGREDVKIIVQDVCDKIIIEDKIDIVLHAAGRADPDAFLTDPVGVIDANVIGTKNVLELARQHDAKVIFISTREVYGAIEDEKIAETDAGILNQVELRSCYPESKRMAENLIICYNHQFGVRYQIARLAHAYGPTMRINGDGRVMADFLGRVVRREEIVLKSDGLAKRAFCYVADAVAGLLLLTVTEESNQIYNLANETEEISIKELASNMAKWFVLGLKIEAHSDQRGYVKFLRKPLDTSKIKSIGWRPLVNLETGIKRTVDFFEQNKRLLVV